MARPALLLLVLLVVAPAAGGEDGFQGREIGRPEGPCATEADRELLDAAIAAHEAEAGPPLAPQAAPLPYRFYPQAGMLWEDLYLGNFVDLDARQQQTLDWDCTNLTYDGHQGLDSSIVSFAYQDIGVPIFAARDGRVIHVQDGLPDRNTSWNQGQVANQVFLDHGDGHRSWYLHMRKGSVAVELGDTVRAGQQLGLTASSGRSTGPHLHFESRRGTVSYEPFAGACRDGESFWTDQVPIRRDVWARDFALTDQSLAGIWPPHALPRGGMFVQGPRSIQTWIMLQQLPARSTWRMTFTRPDGLVARDSGTRDFGNDRVYPRSFWTWSNPLALDAVGTWRFRMLLNGDTVVDVPFEVVRAEGEIVNRPPRGVSLRLDPPSPTPRDVVFCRVETSLVDEDPDFDVIGYRYTWSVDGRTIREVTSAALSDAIPHSEAEAGQLLACRVTPTDLQAEGPSTSAEAAVVRSPDFAPVAPVEGLSVHADDPPEMFRWEMGEMEEFRVEWSRSSTFRGPRKSSGKAWVGSDSLQPDPARWRSILRLGRSTGGVYWRVRGRNGDGRRTRSPVRALRVPGA